MRSIRSPWSHGIGITCLLAGLVVGRASGEEPPLLTLADFAYSMELSPEGEAPVHSALLPAAVYRGALRRDLADLRVFNAAGAQVPHAVRTLDRARAVALGDVTLPLFPVADRQPPAASDGHSEGLWLHVERDSAGTVIDLRPGGAANVATDGGVAAEPAPVRAYILDARGLPEPIVALRFEIEAGAADYVFPVQIAQSGDLASFRSVRGLEPLVHLAFGAERIERDRVQVPALDADFLRISWPDADPLPGPIRAVHAVLQSRADAEHRESLRVKGTARADSPGVYDFDLGGQLPVDAVRLVLPEDNTLVEMTLATRASPDAKERTVQRGRAYRVRHGGELFESPALDVPRRTERYWVVHVAARGSGLNGALPELELAHYQDQLLFVARGAGPYQLAYGQHAAGPSGFDAPALLALLPKAAREALPRSDTTLGAPRERAGRAALTPPPPPPPYKSYLLWAVLVLGVGILGLAALRIARS